MKNKQPRRAETVLVEAESFENLGGWVVDQQFMDQMGSSFLLAHGVGFLVYALLQLHEMLTQPKGVKLGWNL